MLDIAEATETDIPQLCELLGTLFTQEVEFVPDGATQRRGLEMIINNPTTGRVFVVRDGDAVVGMANLLYTVSTALGERVALLEDVIVAPAHQHVGIGKQLIEYVKVYAAAHACRRITLLTDSDNKQGQHFYESCGFTKSSMLPMRLSL